MLPFASFVGYGGGAYRAIPVYFDGTNDYIEVDNDGGTEQSTVDATVAWSANNGYTFLDRTWAVDNSKTVHALRLYATTAMSGTLYIVERTSPGVYDVVDSLAFSHGGANWEYFNLSTPYAVPASGNFYVAVHSSSYGTVGYDSATARSIKNGTLSGTGNSMTEDASSDAVSVGAAYGTPAMSGAADSKLLTISFWYRRISATHFVQQLFDTGGEDSTISIQANGDVGISFENIATKSDVLGAVIAAPDDTGWHNLVFSCDLSDTAKRHAYVDGSSASVSWTTYSNSTMHFRQTQWALGAVAGSSSPDEEMELADVFIAPGQYVDLSIAANRAKFIQGGKPVDLGADGSTPLGAQPLVFLSGAVDAWHTNKGSGGGFTEYGALTEASTSPSD